jgi:hypothetical protein
MKAKTGNAKDIQAIEQWLKKKPLDDVSRRVIMPETVREPVKTQLLSALEPEESLCWMIDVPPKGIYHPQRAGSWLRKLWQIWELTPARLVALTGQRLLLITTTSAGIPPQVTAIPLDSILYLEHGMVLLFSWLSVYWYENHVPREEVIYFDSVDEEIFMPLILMLRSSIARRDKFDRSAEPGLPLNASRWDAEQQMVNPRDRDAFRNLPLKFLNLVPDYGLLNDEHICEVLLRPAQWRKRLGLARVITAPQMVVLRTDIYLLLAAEDVSRTNGGYGLTLTFLPCRYVRSVQVHRDERQCSLNISLETQKFSRDWSISFPIEMEAAVRGFTSRLDTDQDAQAG